MKRKMIKPRIWSEESIINKAKQFKTRKEWQIKCNSSYTMVRRIRIFDKAVAHMPQYRVLLKMKKNYLI